jgi:RHS repeat-associated protein
MPNRHGDDNQYRYGFNGQQRDDEIKGDGNSVNFEFRMHDPRVGRFLSIDPMFAQFPYNSPYTFCENSTIDSKEMEGLEMFTPMLGVNDVILMESGAARTPMIESLKPAVETAIEVSAKVSTRGTSGKAPMPKEVLQRFARGNASEAEQLSRRGVDKNTELIENSEGRSIPDGLTEGGKRTLEIKDVKYQALTRQLRTQKKFSNDNGFTPELLIRTGAKLSGPLKNAGFDITYFSQASFVVNNVLVNLKSQQTANIQKVGNITFDSNKIRKSSSGILIAKDIKTGKDFGVVRDAKTGKYDFYRGKNGK